MLPRHEKRLLAEIEHQLCVDDPDLGRRLADTRVLPRIFGWLSAVRVLALIAAFLAVVCVLVGEGSGFVMAGVLAGVLLWFSGRGFQIE